MNSISSRNRNDEIRKLLGLLDGHRPGEAAHAQRVAVYAVAMGERLGLPPEKLVILKEAALLHDLGKLGVDARILAKSGELNEDALPKVRLHAELFAKTHLPGFLEPCQGIVRHHHERWDGGGYPDKLSGEAIPIESRLIAVAEYFDVACNGAGWANPRSEAEAIAEVRSGSGTKFWPGAVQAFLEIQPLIQPLV